MPSECVTIKNYLFVLISHDLFAEISVKFFATIVTAAAVVSSPTPIASARISHPIDFATFACVLFHDDVVFILFLFVYIRSACTLLDKCLIYESVWRVHEFISIE